MKVGKEEICGLLAALEAFQNEDHDRLQQEWTDRVESLASQLDRAPELEPTVSYAEKSGFVPILTVTVDEEEAELSVTTLVRSLREEDPRVYVGADDLHMSQFTINPLNLSDEEIDYLANRVFAVLGH
jgi:L-seryl-tRNA(Ser) seleniumtransferase